MKAVAQRSAVKFHSLTTIKVSYIHQLDFECDDKYSKISCKHLNVNITEKLHNSCKVRLRQTIKYLTPKAFAFQKS